MKNLKMDVLLLLFYLQKIQRCMKPHFKALDLAFEILRLLLDLELKNLEL